MDIRRFHENLSNNQKFLIMVAEDRADQAQYLAHILRAHDYRVICVRDGLRALDLITAGMVPHVLVTDLKMPTLNGFELMEEMKRLELHIPTIITSGSKSTGNFEEAYLLGAEDYLVKPFSPVQLLGRLHRVLNHHQK